MYSYNYTKVTVFPSNAKELQRGRERVKVQIYSFLTSEPDAVDKELHALAALNFGTSPATRFTVDWLVYIASEDGFGE